MSDQPAQSEPKKEEETQPAQAEAKPAEEKPAETKPAQEGQQQSSDNNTGAESQKAQNENGASEEKKANDQPKGEEAKNDSKSNGEQKKEENGQAEKGQEKQEGKSNGESSPPPKQAEREQRKEEDDDERPAPHHERQTQASRSRSVKEGSPLPAELDGPASVHELAKMTAMERILYEEKQRKLSASRRRSTSPNFAATVRQMPVSPQRARRDQQEKERQERIERETKYRPAPAYKEVPKEPKSSCWAKCTTPRMSYQFPWTKFPQAAPQESLIKGTPGPGAYGSSISFFPKGK